MGYMTDERRMIQETARAFAMKEVLPLANKLDPEKGDIPRELIQKLADMGYFGIVIPEEYGGMGLGVFEYCLVAEELARAWMSVASIIARGNGLSAGRGMTDAQRKVFLPRAARGEFLGAAAMSEPDVGSDLGNISCRAKKEGDEVKLTLVRGGKEMTVKAKLAVREMAKQPTAFFFQNGEPGNFNWMTTPPDGIQDLAKLRALPGMGPDDARDVLRMIEHERGNFLIGPGVRILGRGGRGSTIVDLPKSNISYSDDEGSIEIKVDDGKRNLTVKNAKGEVAFDGPINSEEERRKLPAEVSKRLEKLETDTMSFDVGGEFKSEMVPLPPEPAAKSKIGRSLGRDHGTPPEPADRPF
jgi:hypothetical protein